MPHIIRPPYTGILRIAERRPPPAQMGARAKGHLHWQLIDREGRVAREGETHNMILDQGLDYVPTYGFSQSMIAYCAVGTDSAAPAVSDTALGAEAARTNTTFAGSTSTRTADGVYDLTKSFEFGYSEANGNLTEFGISPLATTPGNLFSRELFRNGSGTPETVTKTSAYKLHIVYTLTVTVTPVTMTAGSFAVAGVGTITGNYTLLSGDTAHGVVGDLGVFNQLANALSTGGGTYNYVYAGGIEAYATDQSAATYASLYNLPYDSNSAHAIDAARDAYVAGSFTRTGGLWKWETGFANIAINAFVISGGIRSTAFGIGGYLFDLDAASVFTKDSSHTLTVGAPTVSWARA